MLLLFLLFPFLDAVVEPPPPVKVVKGKFVYLSTLPCYRMSTDTCCQKVSLEEFGPPLELIPTASWGTQPNLDHAVRGKSRKRVRREGMKNLAPVRETSTKSMVTRCYDTRPEPLPISSPERIIRRAVTVYCYSGYTASIETVSITPFLNPETGRWVSSTTKGRCFPAYGSERYESAQRIKNRNNRVYDRKRWAAKKARAERGPVAIPDLNLLPEEEEEDDEDEDEEEEEEEEVEEAEGGPSTLCVDTFDVTPDVQFAASILASITLPESSHRRSLDYPIFYDPGKGSKS